MTMHLVGPYLSTTGKRKGKPKFRNAEEAKRARELAESWEKMQKKWETTSKPVAKQSKKDTSWSYSLSVPADRSTRNIPSRNTGDGIAAAPKKKEYSGTLIKGLGQMHKSNAVPILNQEDAIAISSMRR